MINDFEIMNKAFPLYLKDEISNILKLVSLDEEQYSGSSFVITLDKEQLTIPDRIYYNEGIIRNSELTESQNTIMDCYFTRHHNGFVRQKHLKNILERGHIDKWAIPYIIQLSGEYVIEILNDIYNNWELINQKDLADFVNNNKEFIFLTEQRIASYWNVYYWDCTKENYVGFKLKEKFNQMRKSI